MDNFTPPFREIAKSNNREHNQDYDIHHPKSLNCQIHVLDCVDFFSLRY